METTQQGVSEVATPEANPRNAAIAEIAKQAALQHEQDTQEANELYGEPQEAAPVETPETPQEAPEAPPEVPEGMVRVKVNGIERLVSQDELVTRFQKEQAAEEKFQEAARLRREAEELAYRLQAPPAQTMTEQDVLTAIRLGTDDEARQAWQMWQQSQANLTAQTARQVVEQRLAQDRFQEFARSNRDLLDDPVTMGALQSYEEALGRSGYEGSDFERWTKAAEVVRSRFQPTAPKVVTAAVSEARREQKATIVNPPLATARRAAPEQPKARTPSEDIERMRASRMKGRGF